MAVPKIVQRRMVPLATPMGKYTSRLAASYRSNFSRRICDYFVGSVIATLGKPNNFD